MYEFDDDAWNNSPPTRDWPLIAVFVGVPLMVLVTVFTVGVMVGARFG